ncbi:hypothetical protein [Solibacillus sp. CAU 1738]|uniref:hypothetical protein n=1 Tax=Solibacillus sp. CAU 1738 TaxID=3140363 RepID=UPI0032608A90
MKKYWKIILISVVIVITISSYYIQLAMASKNDVSFKIETISGNNEEINNLLLQASYHSDKAHHLLTISEGGVTVSDQMNRSFIEDLMSGRYVPLVFQNYIQEHRNFMRGKVLHESRYFEDEARLIYATFLDNDQKVILGNPLTLQIDILDKHTNDSSSFKINTPAQASYDWINLTDIYVENGKIKILASGFSMNGGQELRIFTVDENKKEFEHDLKIAPIKPDEEMYNIRLFIHSDKIQNEKYYLYYVNENNNQFGRGQSESIPGIMYLYNNTNNEVEEWEIPAKLKPNIGSIVVQGEYIYIPVHSVKGLELNRYNIEKKQWEESIHHNYANTSNFGSEPFLQLSDGKLYLVSRVSDGHLLMIDDLNTGESLYEGKIIIENREDVDSDYSLYINQLYIIN